MCSGTACAVGTKTEQLLVSRDLHSNGGDRFLLALPPETSKAISSLPLVLC